MSVCECDPDPLPLEAGRFWQRFADPSRISVSRDGDELLGPGAKRCKHRRRSEIARMQERIGLSDDSFEMAI
jgi:hypothetical protein